MLSFTDLEQQRHLFISKVVDPLVCGQSLVMNYQYSALSLFFSSVPFFSQSYCYRLKCTTSCTKMLLFCVHQNGLGFRYVCTLSVFIEIYVVSFVILVFCVEFGPGVVFQA